MAAQVKVAIIALALFLAGNAALDALVAARSALAPLLLPALEAVAVARRPLAQTVPDPAARAGRAARR